MTRSDSPLRAGSEAPVSSEWVREGPKDVLLNHARLYELLREASRPPVGG